MTARSHRPAASLAATAALALVLGGCKPDHRPPPQADAGLPQPGPLDPAAVAPAAYGYAPPPAQAYAYPKRAYAVSRAVYSRPPTYAFAYGDEQPWVWDAADDGQMFAEPIADGWRYYYYEPGEAYPYFVQDPDYGYAYSDSGALIALFAATGALLGADQYAPVEYRARDYWRRGYDLDTTWRRSPRYQVDEQVWRERAPTLIQTQSRWFQAASARPAWRDAPTMLPPELRHDHGRHLGWFKDHDRQVATAPPPPEAMRGQAWRPPERNSTPPARQDVQAEHGRRAPPPQAFARAEPPRPAYAHGPEPWRETRHEAPRWNPPQAQPHHEARMARAERPEPPRVAQDGGRGHGRGGLGGGGHERGGGGPPASAASAEQHGQAAAWRAPAPPGPPQGHPGEGGGGRHGGGRGGGGEQGGGKQGGRPGGGDPHGRGHDHG